MPFFLNNWRQNNIEIKTHSSPLVGVNDTIKYPQFLSILYVVIHLELISLILGVRMNPALVAEYSKTLVQIQVTISPLQTKV